MASIIIYCFIGVLMKFIYCFGNFNNIWILGRYRCICSLPTVVASSFLFPFLSMADGMGREGYRLIVSLVFQLAPEERIVAQTFPFCPELRAGGARIRLIPMSPCLCLWCDGNVCWRRCSYRGFTLRSSFLLRYKEYLNLPRVSQYLKKPISQLALLISQLALKFPISQKANISTCLANISICLQ